MSWAPLPGGAWLHFLLRDPGDYSLDFKEGRRERRSVGVCVLLLYLDF